MPQKVLPIPLSAGIMFERASYGPGSLSLIKKEPVLAIAMLSGALVLGFLTVFDSELVS